MPVDAIIILWIQVQNTPILITQEWDLRSWIWHLADNKLAFRLVEIMYGNFEVELERDGGQTDAAWRRTTLTGAGPLRMRPAEKQKVVLANGGNSSHKP